LIFEDLDSLISPDVRSYFLNEVDGLSNNDGIFMVGSTNHIEWLDPGISKRPSRFDRKYFFPNPDKEQRVAYCHFWQGKLKDNKNVEFPDSLCEAIADITDKFSFAYIPEAFVAALLAIAISKDEDVSDAEEDDDPNDKYILWREIKKQIKNLRKEMGAEKAVR
jgi:transitional endoplasmic reticulum ATPase